MGDLNELLKENASLKKDIDVFNQHYKLIIAHNMVAQSKCRAVKDQEFELAAKLRDEQRSIEDELTGMQATIQQLSNKYSKEGE